jgi:hypothetical protein
MTDGDVMSEAAQIALRGVETKQDLLAFCLSLWDELMSLSDRGLSRRFTKAQRLIGKLTRCHDQGDVAGWAKWSAELKALYEKPEEETKPKRKKAKGGVA